MPSFVWSRAMTANQLGDSPLTGWQYEYVPVSWPRGAVVRIMQRATTNGVRQTLYSGSQTILQRGPVQGGGTAGNTPAQLTTPPIEYFAQPGDRLIIQNDEVAGGTPTVDGFVSVDPL